MTPAIEINDLHKAFGKVKALDGLDLSVRTGHVHGFLGPNGAGKSTTIRILLGVLRADAGRVRLLGGDPWTDAVALHHRLAYVPGDVELWPNLTGGEAIDLFARLRGGADRTRRDELCERFDLDPTKKGRTYSKGNRQKVALVSALASDVELLLLDEPTAGLDPLMEAVFQECIREARDAGRTVLLSSHILAQVEALADRVSIVRHGRIVETGTLTELRHLTRTSVTATTDRDARALADLPGVHDLRTEDGQLRFDVDGDHLGDAVRRLGELDVHTLTAHPPTLEQLLLRHYGDDLTRTGDGATAGRTS
ncbi:ABC transporter ATP-binding protein [Actinomadura madurae]|uniref:ABC transporter ATP-binding protein n=1 Tax=Actinomadura madurae TaxID=1993 RepID=UPI002026612F|nr:ABC transporter ATP-binding protein [Actinomadura madurae]MCP9955421.1 ABC transporter ATP-binding protein [Actinomadura madurae]MCP9972153.1 ABC transporter ATP-binding protein [Actinomadura madurae]MCP9984658.1 ABC transporter ATP-binding protein [Actinomadura madurae]MCQ0003791.1 ABC transporter ATP-binding protein [Actinomadura madurae]MCQ0020850.1 ABC transporter ATP-binding protein [Actinomadura madurae]